MPAAARARPRCSRSAGRPAERGPDVRECATPSWRSPGVRQEHAGARRGRGLPQEKTARTRRSTHAPCLLLGVAHLLQVSAESARSGAAARLFPSLYIHTNLAKNARALPGYCSVLPCRASIDRPEHAGVARWSARSRGLLRRKPSSALRPCVCPSRLSTTGWRRALTLIRSSFGGHPGAPGAARAGADARRQPACRAVRSTHVRLLNLIHSKPEREMNGSHVC